MLFSEYDATRPTTRRKVPVSDLRNEDYILEGHGRDTLITSSRDMRRNYAIAAAAVRLHLDFVSDFRFHAKTHDKSFNERLSKHITGWQHKKRCHVARRHPLRRLLRMQEACRTLDGDILFEKMRNGSINLIRSDRLRSPHGFDGKGWINGVKVHPVTGELMEFHVCKRTKSGSFVKDKVIPAKNAILHGYFDDPEQIRGVSPLSTAINNFRDTYEGIEYALARLKIEQLIGYAITNVKATTSGNPFAGNRQFEERVFPEKSPEELEEIWKREEEEEARKGIVDYNQGVYQFELRDGEDIKNVGGNMPSSNAQAFLMVCIQIALKALDIPYCFYSEDFTNYSGMQVALQLYKRSTKHKQRDNAEMLADLTEWTIRRLVIERQLELPRGWRIDDLEWQWVPCGIPPWDRTQEVTGVLMAMSAGLLTPQEVCLEFGPNTFEENVGALKEAATLWKSELGDLGIPFGFMQFPGQTNVGNQTDNQSNRKAVK
ncbi:MAG TPA: phage portal protein [Planctomicrobium sp.]|nr:phage portal protein [Planctomicrobium sp.]